MPRRRRQVEALILVVALSFPLARCQAQVMAQAPMRAAPGVAAQLQRVQFRVQAGRIHCTSEAVGGRLSFSAKSLGREETLTIDLSAARPAIEYALVGRKSRTSVTVSDGDRVRISRHPQGKAAVVPMQFEQTPDTSLLLIVGADDAQRTVRAPTFWHLLLAEPKLVEEHLIPILEILRPGWPLAGQARELEDSLFQLGQQSAAPDRAQLATLVAQLGDEQFSRRQQADRELRALGNSALSYLQGLDRETLDAEQQFRIRRLIGRLAGAGDEDAPLAVARRIINDPRVWLSLLRREESDLRSRACDQLRRVLGTEVEFDPAADDAVRQAQVAALEKSLGLEP